MTTEVFVDGAAGTTGLEIVARLEAHPHFTPVVLEEARRKDADARREALNDTLFAVLCLPDDAAREAVELVDPAAKTRIVDASSAHRVADGWTYGFPELIGRERIADAARVSNPGCYPTGFLALVAPLVRAGLLPADWPFTVNAVSGYSGGGKALIERFADEPDIAFRTYGLNLTHKHLPEMQRHAGLDHAVLFAPSVVPAYRGMLVEVPLHLGAMRTEPTADALRDELARFYADSEVVEVMAKGDPGELLLHRDAAPDDGMRLHVFGNEGGWNARLVALLDNLGKGASGAAIQNLNLMAGFPETASLQLR
ncbi:N-acetyl-gamma-glutamyl-phosphate reductase [Citromicrobium sp. WPS32]|uniref:N-acetyl-gamma-glutamyl-phosphate reductase n=1 Tax=Citromicrobium sp. WPS32 TaxID=1634517 RepID=UPI0006C90A55|nr:N-acetyl-gamma-glutamyl-phosphate reductase [Citromicrobium sp. WPS32]KPM15801.1 N-acetyl-gamma-glutamyl-phosphate reductase [Citromicrobium sp. WPS32]MAY78002.1 N-acetyl-gamma-glutamyl-phosphate reductase [Citromicrobium sp.]|tara:strand:+ start:2133 stop:3065 length:933 start_codon:yes stop_codon:yes gene_type:complete